MKSSSDFLQVCAKNGLTIAKIKSVKDLKSIIMLSFDQYYPFHKEEGIIIGYDFSCAT